MNLIVDNVNIIYYWLFYLLYFYIIYTTYLLHIIQRDFVICKYEWEESIMQPFLINTFSHLQKANKA